MGQSTSAGGSFLTLPRAELHDAAVKGALTYAVRLGLPLNDPEKLKGGLELWYLKTRFAYRVPLNDVLAALSICPDSSYSWRGGADGGWLPGTDAS